MNRIGADSDGPTPTDSPVAARMLAEGTPGRTTHSTLQLLGGFHLLVDGQRIHLPRAEQRLLACVALAERPTTRSRLAGRLWPDTAEPRAMARLRTALWRLRQPGRLLLDGSSDEVGLEQTVAVDVQDLTGLARRFLDAPLEANDDRLTELTDAGELLPEWDDDWVTPHRERFRQIRLHALELIGVRLAEEGRYGRAVEVSLAVVADDPLRESGSSSGSASPRATSTRPWRATAPTARSCARSWVSNRRRRWRPSSTSSGSLGRGRPRLIRGDGSGIDGGVAMS